MQTEKSGRHSQPIVTFSLIITKKFYVQSLKGGNTQTHAQTLIDTQL